MIMAHDIIVVGLIFSIFVWRFLFLLGFSGILQSRMDLYCVNYFLPKGKVGQYQVFANVMTYWQSLAAFILIPFVKNMYRLPEGSILKIETRLFVFGIVMLVPALALTHVILSGLYHFTISFSILLFGGLLVLPVYLYVPIIYVLYRASLQSAVLTISLLGAVVSLSLNLALLPRVGMIGAVLASTAAQWLMLIAWDS